MMKQNEFPFSDTLLKTHPDPASKSARVLVDIIDLKALLARGAMALRITVDKSVMVVMLLMRCSFRGDVGFTVSPLPHHHFHLLPCLLLFFMYDTSSAVIKYSFRQQKHTGITKELDAANNEYRVVVSSI